MLASLPDGTACTVEKVTLSMQLLEKLNDSPYTCKVAAVLETDPNNPQIATKVMVVDPMGAEGVSPTLMYMDRFMEDMTRSKNQDGKQVFRAVLTALLDLRLRLPPIYNLKTSDILVDKATFDVKIIVSDALFSKDSNIMFLEKTDLMYKSPEELLGHGKSLTTPFWVLGCQIYEARYGINPFDSHLKTQVSEMFIKYYPCMFPEDQEQPEEAFKDLILHLLIKDPLACISRLPVAPHSPRLA